MLKYRKIILFDIDNTLFNTLHLKETDLQIFSVYEEVHEVLAELAKICDLGIFSQGEIAFQKKKLLETNIDQYFLKEHTHIVTDKIAAAESIIKKYENKGELFFVDDLLKALHVVHKTHPWVFTVLMKRGEYAMAQDSIEGFTPDASVNTLTELIPLIKNN